MANMSYCRFQNTLNDLKDCYNALKEEGGNSLSREETSAFSEMMDLCEQIAEDHNNGEFDFSAEDFEDEE